MEQKENLQHLSNTYFHLFQTLILPIFPYGSETKTLTSLRCSKCIVYDKSLEFL